MTAVSPLLRLAVIACAAAAAAVPAAIHAQAVCKPDASTSEARLLAHFAGPLAFAATPALAPLGAREVAIFGEVTGVPSAPSGISASSGACGFAKSENSGLAPVFPRPRLAVGLGQGMVVEVSWLPPVTVADATPNLGGVALAWTPSGVTLPFGASLTVRAHATLGGVEGPVTCPRAALQAVNPAAPCYGSVPSDDRYEPNVRGAEVIATRRDGRWQWNAGLGINAVAARFRVNFTDQRGFVDNNVVEISMARVAVMGGGAWEVRDDVSLSAQLYSVPSDATTARVGIGWRVR